MRHSCCFLDLEVGHAVPRLADEVVDQLQPGPGAWQGCPDSGRACPLRVAWEPHPGLLGGEPCCIVPALLVGVGFPLPADGVGVFERHVTPLP